MSILFTKLYIRTDLDAEVIILDDVTGMKRGMRWLRTGTYRNTGWTPGQAAPEPPTTGGITPSTLTTITAVPVVGQNGALPGFQGFNGLVYATPDEMLQIAPRYRKSRESGYLFAFDTLGTIDEPAADVVATPRFAARAVTINTTTDACNATAHPFVNGDVIALYAATTLPAGYTANSLSTVVVVDADNFLLLNSAGSIVNFTSIGSGTITIVLVSSALPPPEDPVPSNQAGIVFVPDAWNPRLSTTDPRL